MLYVQSYYREITEYPTLNDYKIPNEYVREITSPGDSYTVGIGSNGKDDHFSDSCWFADGKCGRYKKGWPEQLRDHSGWKDLQNDGDRQNNYGACSGHVIDQIEKQQLSLGEPKEGQFKAIGKPQLIVLTAGGNDFLFGDVVLKCILRIYGGLSGNCEKTIKSIEDKITKRDEAIKLYQGLFSHIIVAGRLSKGATNPEEFQVYIGAYIPFFNAGEYE
jgi:lysophospholipase L1-like esterase